MFIHAFIKPPLAGPLPFRSLRPLSTQGFRVPFDRPEPQVIAAIAALIQAFCALAELRR